MKIAIVTGAASGIGLAIAQRFLSEGYQVYGMSRRAEAPLSHPAFHYIAGDISSAADRARLLSTAGAPDVLVNAAGVAPAERRDLLTMTEESFDRVLDINLKGTFFLTQQTANAMLAAQKGGAICNISSISAYTDSLNRGEYCISKAGLSMVTQLFADRLAEHGITVNEVRPGIIATDMTAGVQEKYDTLIQNGLLPIARWGTPEDVAEAVWTLCNGKLGYTAGQILNADGGFHIRRL